MTLLEDMQSKMVELSLAHYHKVERKAYADCLEEDILERILEILDRVLPILEEDIIVKLDYDGYGELKNTTIRAVPINIPSSRWPKGTFQYIITKDDQAEPQIFFGKLIEPDDPCDTRLEVEYTLLTGPSSEARSLRAEKLHKCFIPITEGLSELLLTATASLDQEADWHRDRIKRAKEALDRV